MHLHPFRHCSLKRLSCNECACVCQTHLMETLLRCHFLLQQRVYHHKESIHTALVYLKKQLGFGTKIMVYHALSSADSLGNIINTGCAKTALHKTPCTRF